MIQTSGLQQPTIIADRDTTSAVDCKLIGLYYRLIHPAHPFLLPQTRYNQDESIFPHHLKHAMCFVASHHARMDVAEKQRLRDTSEAVFEPGVPTDIFKVQTLLLLTITSYARFEREQGTRALHAAISTAYEIGLDSDACGQAHDSLLQESLRRTWWELYTVTGLISLVSGTQMRLNQPERRALPGDCSVYNAAKSSPTPNNDVCDMRRRFRAEDTSAWSSFAYKVEAMRILSMVLDAPAQHQDDSSQAGSQAAEAAVASFLLSLPEDKREALKPDGEVDEVMSCAFMIIHLASICVHLPLSPLVLAGDFRTVCGNHLNQAGTLLPRTHQAAAIKSANAIARLITSHGGDLATLSPCFSCALAFSSSVLLAAYSIDTRGQGSAVLEENLNLELSALRLLGHIWPVAVLIRSQIAQFARDVISTAQDVDASHNGGLEQLPSPLDDQWLQDLLGDVDMLQGSPDFDVTIP